MEENKNLDQTIGDILIRYPNITRIKIYRDDGKFRNYTRENSNGENIVQENRTRLRNRRQGYSYGSLLNVRPEILSISNIINPALSSMVLPPMTMSDLNDIITYDTPRSRELQNHLRNLLFIQQESPESSAIGLTNYLFSSDTQNDDEPLHPQIRDSLIRRKTTEEHKKDTCSICIQNYSHNEEIVLLPCKHHFHTDCIGKWFDEHSKCPNCRYNMTLK
jgi:hypothetical protein